MIAALRDRADAFFGRGRHSTSIPVMDGPLQPNHLLDQAPVVAEAPELDNLVAANDDLLFSSGARLLQLRRGASAPDEVLRVAGPISCLAAGHDSAIAIGLDGVGVEIHRGRHSGRRIEELGTGKLVCPTAALFLSDDVLIVASGSRRFRAAEWKHDLMSLGASGSVWRVDLASGKSEPLAQSLAFPYGLARAPGDDILVSEAWRHRIIRLGSSPGANPVLEGLPGYPARIVSASDGGYWLSVFAPRNQLVEFVLRERAYCAQMMSRMPPDFWIAPSLLSGASFKEPMQGGAVKQMGILKPWAPARSYGLVVRTDSDLRPAASWHSRADGRRHGVTSLCERSEGVIAGVKGAGIAVAIASSGTYEEAAH